jgi:signal transduction histidine kinase
MSFVDKPDSGGAGLGLAIVGELITGVGGTVVLADSETPWHTRAELRLPMAEPQQSRTNLVANPFS